MPATSPGASANMAFQSPVEFVRPELALILLRYIRIRAACAGAEAVKELREGILPKPNSTDTSKENEARYEAYLERAVWYNVSARTLEGLVGYVFTKDPTVELPVTLKTMEDNVDGSGVTLLQQAKSALRAILSLGRAGLLVDYPQTDGPTTAQQLLDGNIQPTIILYQPEQIINWRVTAIGAKKVLTLIVLRESYWEESDDDQFRLLELVQFRVLDIITEDTDFNETEEGESAPGLVGTVRGRVFQQIGDGKDYVENHSLTYYPTDSAGQPLKEIPFTFLGAVDNNSDIDNPPLADMVELNIAHFRNSADYEEACFICGQPTPYVSGLTKQWVDEVLKGVLHLGSRAVIPLPSGGQAGLLQAAPNSLPHEAMLTKEQQMIALGAKIVEANKVQRTATEASIDHTSEVSILTTAANNIFLGYKIALGFACTYIGADNASLTFELSEPLTHDTITALEAQAISSLWMGGLIDFEEARAVLRKSGLAYKEDDEVQKENENALPPILPNPRLLPGGRPALPPAPPAPPGQPPNVV